MIRSNYIVIPLLAIIFILIQIVLMQYRGGMVWYKSLTFPRLAPSDHQFMLFFGIVFGLAVLSAILIWNFFEHNFNFWVIMALFCLITALNTLWCYLFFMRHSLGLAFLTVLAIQCFLIILARIIYARSLLIGLLLVPYIIWGFYDIYWSFMMWFLNK